MATSDDDPVGYLISEFEVLILRLARELDVMRKRVETLESERAVWESATAQQVRLEAPSGNGTQKV